MLRIHFLYKNDKNTIFSRIGSRYIAQKEQSGPEVIKLFHAELSTKFILLINVKMPTTVGILTFISMINTTSERLKARNLLICQYFGFYEQLNLRAQLS